MSSVTKHTVVTIFITVLFYSASVTCKHKICHECILGHVKQTSTMVTHLPDASQATAQGGCDASLCADCTPDSGCTDASCTCICHISVALCESPMYSSKPSNYVDCIVLLHNPDSGFANRLERPPRMHA